MSIDMKEIASERTADGAQQLAMLAAMVMLIEWSVRTLSGRLHVLGPTTAWLTIGLIGVWRWGWGATHFTRAVWYRYISYPFLARNARAAVAQQGPVSEVVVLATTYCERRAITDLVVKSVLIALLPLPKECRSTVVVVTGSEDDDNAVRRAFDAVDYSDLSAQRARAKPELILLRGDQGKRPAIATGLRYIAKRGVDPDGVTVLMDGDSAPDADAFEKALPLFRLCPQLGAVTTNESANIDGPTWFTEWIKLRFGQRHMYMCSVSLSQHLLCLTGRFSIFRADIATNPGFINQIEADHLQNWLFGEYQMLSGDDKSTWYWLSAHGYRTLYVPDAMVRTFEAVTERSVHRAVANLKRWSGNMLRNSRRAISLGPARLGLFPWLCCIDQLVSFWTVLIGPTCLALGLFRARWDLVASYALWLLATRTVRVASAWRHGKRISLWYVPMQIVSEWVGAMVKVWVVFHPVKQNWLNRGNRTLDSSELLAFARVRRGVATLYCSATVVAFVLAVGTATHLLPFGREFALVWRAPTQSTSSAAKPPPSVAEYFGIRDRHADGGEHLNATE